MTEAKSVAKNTFYQLVGKFVTMGVTLIATALITRSYGVESYGAFSLMVSFPALFYIIANFGLNTIAVRELSTSEERMNDYVGLVFVVRLLFSALLILLAVGLLYLLPYSSYLRIGIIIGLLTIITTSVFSSFNIAFQVKLRYDLSSISNSIGSLIFLFLLFLILYLKLGILFIISSYVLNGIVTCVLSYVFVKRLGVFPLFKINKKLIKPLLISSLPLGLMFVFSQVNFKADSILLSILPLPASFGLNNIETVGIYGLPYKVFEVSLIIPTFFMNSAFPILVRHRLISKDKLFSSFKKSLFFLLGSGLLVSILGYVFAPLAISILGGEGFSNSVAILRILLGFIFIFYLTQPFAWFIITLNGQRYLPWIYLFAGVLNIFLNIMYIPKYSYFASANLTWISELVVLTLLIITARKLYQRA